MNINSINAKSNDKVTNSENKNSCVLSTYKKGQVVEGLITKVSDKISIDFSGDEVIVPNSTVQDAKEGEIRRFEIMDVSKTSIVLKEVGNSTNDSNSIKATWISVDIDQSILTERRSKVLKEKEKEEDLKTAKEKLDEILNKMTGKDFRELSALGVAFEKYNLERLDKALERIKKQQELKQDCLESQMKEIKNIRTEVHEKIRNSTIGGFHSARIAEKLEDANLPITRANIERVATVLELGSSINHLSDQAKSYLIRDQLPLTIENIYKARYCEGTASATYESAISSHEWNEIKPQVEKVLVEANLEVNDKNLDQSKWILNHNLPLTKESLQKLNTLNQLSYGMHEDLLLDKIINTVRDGIGAEKTLLEEDATDLSYKLRSDITHISDAAIIKVANENNEITLENLKEANKNLSEQDLEIKIQMDLEDFNSFTENDMKAITAKRQLEEIRLKMTVEASRKLTLKGIHIETESLGKLVEELKEIEDNYYKSLLKEAGTTGDSLKAGLLKITTERLNELKQMPSFLLGMTLNSKSIETIDHLHATGETLKHRLDKAGEAYDTLMTSPRKDLGDSIQKAFQNIDHILEDLNLDRTEANKRAVKILGYNKMEITSDSIAEVKLYDSQVNALIKNLKPSIAVHLIKEGMNPLETPIEELNNHIAQMKEELGVTEEEKYSKFLWKLDKEQGLSEEERKGYIGLYRLLNKIEKTDGAAIGSVIGTGQDVTLKNLLTAVRTMKSKGMNQVIDNDFGTLTDISFSKETITQQLSSVFKEDNINQHILDQEKNHSVEDKENQIGIQEDSISTRIEYMNLLIQNIMDEIAPNKVGQIANEENILDMPLEKLNEKLSNMQENEGIETDYSEKEVARLQELASTSEHVIKFLEEYNMPTTISNLFLANEYLNSKTSIFKKLEEKLNNISDDETNKVKEELDSFMDALEDKDTMISKYEKLDESITKILNKEYESSTITAKDIAELRSLTNGIHFINDLSKKECYEIPISLNGEVTNINLTVVEGEKETGKIHIKTELVGIKTVSADFTIKGNEVKGFITCSNRDALDILQENKGILIEAIANLEEDKTESNIANTNEVNQKLGITQLNYGIDHNVINNKMNIPSFLDEKVLKKVPTKDEIISKKEIAIDETENNDIKDLESESKIRGKNSTNQLYQVAKTFILHIKMIDQMINNREG